MAEVITRQSLCFEHQSQDQGKEIDRQSQCIPEILHLSERRSKSLTSLRIQPGA